MCFKVSVSADNGDEYIAKVCEGKITYLCKPQGSTGAWHIGTGAIVMAYSASIGVPVRVWAELDDKIDKEKRQWHG